MHHAIVPATTPAPTAAQEREHVFVTFQIAHQLYGLGLPFVREIVRLPALTPLAGSPPMLCGLLNLRGQYLPILNGRVLVDEPSFCDLSSQILIIGREQPAFGLLVDHVQGIATLSQRQLRPMNRSDIAPFLSGIGDIAGASVLLFDPERLLALAVTDGSLQTNV